jgi:hypothetical protein
MPSLANDSSAWLRMCGVRLGAPRSSPSQSVHAASIPLSDIKSGISKIEEPTELKGGESTVDHVTTGEPKVAITTSSSLRSFSNDGDNFLVVTADPLLCFSYRPTETLAESNASSLSIATGTNVALVTIKPPYNRHRSINQLDSKLLESIFDHVSRYITRSI